MSIYTFFLLTKCENPLHYSHILSTKITVKLSSGFVNESQTTNQSVKQSALKFIWNLDKLKCYEKKLLFKPIYLGLIYLMIKESPYKTCIYMCRVNRYKDL